MSNIVMRNAGSPGMLNVPPEETSWLKSTLASLGSASRAVLLGATALVSVCASTPAGAQQPASTQPNILFIMGDDIGWMQPSIYHRGLAVGETPNIDRIGNEGALFMTYYAEQSCTAGRTAFITGMHPVRVGMVLPEIPGSPSYLRPGTPHLAKFMHDLGYTTGEFGKNHLGDTTELLTHRARVPRILGLPLSSRCHARRKLPRHQQVPDRADRSATLHQHADHRAWLRFRERSTPRRPRA